MNFPVTIRPLAPTSETERHFVLNSWLRSNRMSVLGRSMRSDTYYRGHHAIVERLMANAVVRVAEVEGRPGELAGWSCGEHHRTQGMTLHFVYVKSVYRRLGVGRALLGTAEYKTVSHWTPIANHVSLLANLTYDPYTALT